MTPVLFLSDGYIANGAEPWLIPKFADLPPIKVSIPTARPTRPRPTATDSNGQRRRATASCRTSATRRLARPWAIPGTPGLEHRIGGLEKADITGNVDYSPGQPSAHGDEPRQEVANIANDIPAAGGRRAPQRASCWSSAGAAPTAPSAPRCKQAQAARQIGRPRAPALPESVPAQPRRDPQALREGAGPGTEHRPACVC